MSERKLASIQQIISLQPISNADTIEAAEVLGWWVVVRKGTFKPNDLCVFFEIDSILPAEAPWAQILKDRKYRVKTIKLRGQVSQGLVFRPTVERSLRGARLLFKVINNEFLLAGGN